MDTSHDDEAQPLEEPLSEPPAEGEGDNSEAGGGKPASPVEEHELEDTPDLEEDDDDLDAPGPDTVGGDDDDA